MINIKYKKSLIGLIVFAVFFAANAFADSMFTIQPSITQNQTQSLSIPLTLNNTSSMNIESIDLGICYDPNVLTATGISLTGTVLENQDYLYEYNTGIAGKIYALFAASTNIYTGTGGRLLNLEFSVIGTSGETSDITICEALLSNVEATTSDCTFSVAPNASPTITGITSQTIDEDTPSSITFTFNDYETSPCDLTPTFESSDESLLSVNDISYTCLAGTMTLTLTPSTDQSGMVTIIITATDSGNLSAVASLNITITERNDTPEISAISDQTTNEDTSITANFTVTDIEDAPCSMSITATSSDPVLLPESNIALACNNGNYTLTATPASNENGHVTITLTIADSNGLTATQSFDLTVTSINDAPILANAIGNRVAIEGSPYTFTIPENTFFDADNDTLTYTATQSDGNDLPSWLSFDPSTRTFSGVPASDSETITITVTATDIENESATDTFKLSINDTNNAPVLDNPIADQTATEDTFYTFTFAEDTFSDSDVVSGDTISYTAMLSDSSPLPSWLTFDENNRNFSGTPEDADIGTITIIVIASDTLNLTATDSFDLTVVGVNDAPIVSAISNQTIDEDMTATITFSVTDEDDTSYTLSVHSSNTSLLPISNISHDCENSSCSMKLTPIENQYGTATITVTASDPQSDTGVSQFDLVVNSVNDAPVMSAITDQTIDEDSSLTGLNLTLTDVEDASCSLDITATSSDITLIPDENITWVCSADVYEFSITPLADQSGTSTIVFASEDSHGSTVSTTFNITITEINDAPILAIFLSDQTATEDTLFSFTLPVNTFTDVDTAYGDSLTYTATLSDGNPLPTWLTFDSASQEFSGTPLDADEGMISIIVTAADTSNETANDTFDLTITGVNDAPILANAIGNRVAIEGSPYTFTIPENTFFDADNDTLTYTATQSDGNALPTWLSFDPSTRTFSGVPASDSETITITVTATDIENESATDTFKLSINDTNNAPVLDNPIADQTATEDTFYTFTFAEDTFSDSDVVSGDTISYTAMLSDSSPLPSWLTFDENNRNFSGTPLYSDTGMITITVIASDTLNLTATDHFYLTIMDVNDPPILSSLEESAKNEVSFTYTVAESSMVWLTVTSSDTGIISNSSINISGTGTNATSIQTTANIAQSIVVSYTPDNSFHDRVTLTVSAYAMGDMSTQTYGVIVSPPGAGNALTFDGIDDYIKVSDDDSLDLASQFTLEIWIYQTNTNSGGYRLIDKETSGGSDGFNLDTHPGNALRLCGNSACFSATEFSLNQWHHVVVVYSGTTATFYLDGVNVGSGSVGSIQTNSLDLYIGCSQLQQYKFSGQMDEIRIWNIARTEAEIKSTMCQRLTGNESGLVAYYRFDHTSGTTLVDMSSNTNDGVLTNMNDANWVTSGAALGDESVYDDTGSVPADFSVTIAHPDGDAFTATGNSGTFDSLHVYLVNEMPNDTTAPNGYVSIDTDHYYGVFPVGSSPVYNIAYNYTDNTYDANAIACRTNNAYAWRSIESTQYAAMQTFEITGISAFSDISATEFTLGYEQAAPAISSIVDQTIDEDTVLQSLQLTITDDTTATCSILIDIVSSDSNLFETQNMAYTCLSNSLYLSLTPTANAHGTATISTTATDEDGLTTTSSFEITVISVNDTPTFSTISSQSMDENSSLNVTMTIADVEGDSLTVTAISSDQTLIADSNITIINDGDMYTITITPTEAEVGIADITIQIDDGADIVSTTFTTTVNEVHYMIAGHVSSYTDISGSSLQNVTLTLSGTYSYTTQTDASGNYTFLTVRPGDYTLTAAKSDDIDLDISDAIQILKAAVKLVTLSCYEKIAADAYIDGYYGAYDASKVAQYVVGTEACLNTSCTFWQFIPEEITNCDTWPLIQIETVRQYNNLSEDVLDQDFIGIGCGNISQ